MPENLYAAPKSSLVPPTVEVPEEVMKDIKAAWIAGLISGSITLAVTIAALFGNESLGVDEWNFVDVVLIFSLTFGIYKKSRLCSATMITYFIGSKIYMWAEYGLLNGSILAILFVYLYAKGFMATVAYHKASQTSKIAEAPYTIEDSPHA